MCLSSIIRRASLARWYIPANWGSVENWNAHPHALVAQSLSAPLHYCWPKLKILNSSIHSAAQPRVLSASVVNFDASSLSPSRHIEARSDFGVRQLYVPRGRLHIRRCKRCKPVAECGENRKAFTVRIVGLKLFKCESQFSRWNEGGSRKVVVYLVFSQP